MRAKVARAEKQKAAQQQVLEGLRIAGSKVKHTIRGEAEKEGEAEEADEEDLPDKKNWLRRGRGPVLGPPKILQV